MGNIIFGEFNEEEDYSGLNDSDYNYLGETMAQELEEIKGLWDHFADENDLSKSSIFEGENSYET